MMTIRQKVITVVYGLFKKVWSSFGDFSKMHKNVVPAPVSFYSLQSELNNGNKILFEQFKGKKILVVNTASDCLFTPQYEALEKLYLQHKGNVEILAFPSNDFKDQDPKSDAEIAQFCKINYGVTFMLMKKSSVLKNSVQHPVFQWLTNKNFNGWNDKAPKWNFCKYIIDEKGHLTHVLGSTANPDSPKFIELING